MSILRLSAHLTSVQKRQTSSFMEEAPGYAYGRIAFHFYKHDTKYLYFNYDYCWLL